MASSSVIVVLSIVAVLIPTVAMAKVFIVGDDSGWTLGFDYNGWAQGKDFRVGDQIVFKYPMGAHNVFKVNQTDFQYCSMPLYAQALDSGSDVVTLATPGKKWYICGVGRHCAIGGMKLAINVQPATMAPMMAPVMSPMVEPMPMPYMTPAAAPSPDTYY